MSKKGLKGLLSKGSNLAGMTRSENSASTPTTEQISSSDYNESVSYDLPRRKYFDQWGQTAYDWLNLKFAMVVMAAIAILSIIFTVATMNNFNRELMHRPIIAVPGAEAPGLYRPGKLPKVVVWDFAKRFVMDIMNFDASRGIELETVSAALSSARNYLSPKAKAGYAPVFTDLIRKAIQNRNSVSFVPSQASVSSAAVKVLPNGRREVKIAGLLKRYVSGNEVSRGEKVVRVIMELVPATDINPYGLQIVNYDVLGGVGGATK